MAYHIVEYISFLTLLLIFQIILTRKAPSRNNHSMQCNTTHGNACIGAALICEEKETYKGR